MPGYPGEPRSAPDCSENLITPPRFRLGPAGGARGRVERRTVEDSLRWPQVTGFVFDLPPPTSQQGEWAGTVPKRGWRVARLLTNAANRGAAQRRWRVLVAGRRIGDNEAPHTKQGDKNEQR